MPSCRRWTTSLTPSRSCPSGETKEAKSLATPVTMPQLGETVVEGTITKWLKKEGETVERDEPLFEISTDKVDTEVPSPLAGKIVEIKVPEGETVGVGTELAMIEAGGDGQAAAPSAEAEAPAQAGEEPEAPKAEPETPEPEAPEPAQAEAPQTGAAAEPEAAPQPEPVSQDRPTQPERPQDEGNGQAQPEPAQVPSGGG